MVLEAVRAGVAEASRVLRDCLGSAHGPAEGVRRCFQAAAGEISESGYALGCPVASIVLDMLEEESALAEGWHASFEEWRVMYRDALVAAGFRPLRAVTLAWIITSSLRGL
ncbi:hypothetical protein [Thioalkalivibrio sp. ALJ3]|uniref:LmrA/YxaF family transcription factor n=1 Tax=Thioalkalivibrio sp. ALJ3 TaxID=1240557 RepID=UPI00035FE8F6|nr:hypothetical protein [Thioalkalivibrio sp. ALJ3]